MSVILHSKINPDLGSSESSIVPTRCVAFKIRKVAAPLRRVIAVVIPILAIGIVSSGAHLTNNHRVAMPDQLTAQNQSRSNGSQSQPQGNTGPLNTGSGGAPASSPQGETPPGMQSAPQGSSEKITKPAK
jgi:hypothetical protein